MTSLSLQSLTFISKILSNPANTPDLATSHRQHRLDPGLCDISTCVAGVASKLVCSFQLCPSSLLTPAEFAEGLLKMQAVAWREGSVVESTAAFLEGPSSIPSAHMVLTTVCTSSSLDRIPLLTSLGNRHVYSIYKYL